MKNMMELLSLELDDEEGRLGDDLRKEAVSFIGRMNPPEDIEVDGEVSRGESDWGWLGVTSLEQLTQRLTKTLMCDLSFWMARLDDREDKILLIHRGMILRMEKGMHRPLKNLWFGHLKRSVNDWKATYEGSSRFRKELLALLRALPARAMPGSASIANTLEKLAGKTRLHDFFKLLSSESYDRPAKNWLWRLSMAIEAEWMRSPLLTQRQQLWKTEDCGLAEDGGSFLPQLLWQESGLLSRGVKRVVERWEC